MSDIVIPSHPVFNMMLTFVCFYICCKADATISQERYDRLEAEYPYAKLPPPERPLTEKEMFMEELMADMNGDLIVNYRDPGVEFGIDPTLAVFSVFLKVSGYVTFMYIRYPAGTIWFWNFVVEPWLVNDVWPPFLTKYALPIAIPVWFYTKNAIYYGTIENGANAIVSTMDFATRVYFDAKNYWWDYPIMCQERLATRDATLAQIRLAFEQAVISKEEMDFAIQRLSVDLYNHRPGCNCFPLPADYSVKIMEANENPKVEGATARWIVNFIADMIYFYYNSK